MNVAVAPARRVLLSLCLATLAALPACGRDQPEVAEFYVFGTLVSVMLAGVEEDQASAAFAELQQRLQAMHRDWHAWEPGLLTTINRAFAAGRAIEADEAFVELVRRSQWGERQTGGRFNPAIGRLIALWGFHTSEFPLHGPPPTPAEIAALVSQRPSTADIEIDGRWLRSSNPAVQLDFGAVAKGYAVDLACEFLRQRGIDAAIVNAGGDLRAFGSPGGRPWRVAIRDPRGGVLGGIGIRLDEAVFTSGNYERFREDQSGRRYAHILDPNTGWPPSGIASATVIAGEGLVADVAATALVVAGLTHWQEVAGPLGITQVLLVDAEGGVHATAAMLERIEWASPVDAALLATDR